MVFAINPPQSGHTFEQFQANAKAQSEDLSVCATLTGDDGNDDDIGGSAAGSNTGSGNGHGTTTGSGSSGSGTNTTSTNGTNTHNNSAPAGTLAMSLRGVYVGGILAGVSMLASLLS
jgi:hypothetical protein